MKAPVATAAMAAFSLLFAAPAGAQPTVTADPMIREGVTEKISEHVHVIPDGGVPLVPNVAIVVGREAVLVVDTGLGTPNAEAVLREARKAAPGRQLYLVTTHVHPEHDLGANGFPADTRMIRSRDQVAEIADTGLQTADAFRRFSPTVARLLEGVSFREADIVFDGEHRLDLGGVSVRILAMGPNHTRGDTAVFVEPDRVLISGDVVMKGPPAFATPQSSMRHWFLSLDRLEALKPVAIVPSHGPMGDASLIGAYREYLAEVRDRARTLQGEGKSADEAAELIADQLGDRYPQRWQVTGAVRAAYREP